MQSRFLFVAAVLVAATPFALPKLVGAAVPTCFGRPATHVLTLGNQNFLSTDDNLVVVGSPGADSIAIAGDNTLVCGNGGNDGVAVAGDGSKVDGGSGDDVLAVAGVGSLVQGGSGSDQIGAGVGATADGGSGDDTIQGGGAGAVGAPVALLGGSGSDTIYNMEGSPRIDCGAAYDLVYITDATDVRRCEGTAPPPN